MNALLIYTKEYDCPLQFLFSFMATYELLRCNIISPSSCDLYTHAERRVSIIEGTIHPPILLRHSSLQDMEWNVPQATMLQSNLSQTSLPDSGIGSLESSYDYNGLQHLNDHSMTTSGPFPSRTSGKSVSCPTTPRHSVSSACGGHTHNVMHRQTSTPIHSSMPFTPKPASTKQYQATFPASYSPARRKQSCPAETNVCPASCGTQVSRLTPVPEVEDDTCLSLTQMFEKLNTKSDHLKTELKSLSSG